MLKHKELFETRLFRRYIAVFLAGILLSACGSDDDNKNNKKTLVTKPIVSLSSAENKGKEGDTGLNPVEFSASLDKAATEKIVVKYQVNDGTATKGSDFVVPEKTEIEFSVGDKTKTIIINVKGDIVFEPDEDFIVKLESVTDNKAKIGAANSVTYTIENDDTTINDTGVTFSVKSDGSYQASCADDAGKNYIEQQDCKQGLDANAKDGKAAFSFTKLAADGSELAADATEWSCVRDNVTGLVWEVKTDDNGLRDKDHTYTTYLSRFNDGDSADSLSKAGTDEIWAGLVDTGVGSGLDSCGNTDKKCSTEQYETDVNAISLCGFSDWRTPRYEEFESIFNYATDITTAEKSLLLSDYFPYNTNSWTASHSRGGASSGAVIAFKAKDRKFKLTSKTSTSDNVGLRLVRSEKPLLKIAAEHGETLREQSPSAQNPFASTVYCDMSLPLTTPVSDFEFNPDGKSDVVLHKPTQLLWKRCPLGSTYNDNGTSEVFTDDKCNADNDFTFQGGPPPGSQPKGISGFAGWDKAAKAVSDIAKDESKNWRLPNIRELLTIRENACVPALNANVFPPVTSYEQSSSGLVWSSTPVLENGEVKNWMVLGLHGLTLTSATGIAKEGYKGVPTDLFQPAVRVVRDAQ